MPLVSDKQRKYGFIFSNSGQSRALEAQRTDFLKSQTEKPVNIFLISLKKLSQNLKLNSKKLSWNS